MSPLEALQRRVADIKEKLGAYEGGSMTKLDSRGRDVTAYEIQSLRDQLKGAEEALADLVRQR